MKKKGEQSAKVRKQEAPGTCSGCCQPVWHHVYRGSDSCLFALPAR